VKYFAKVLRRARSSCQSRFGGRSL